MVEIGDTVFERLQIGESRTTKPYKGTVIYVHPKNRFYRAEFKMPNGIIREAFKIWKEVRVFQDEVDEKHKRPMLAEFNKKRRKNARIT